MLENNRLPKQHTAILDSGTTGHYIQHHAPCINKQQSPQPVAVNLPDGTQMHSTHTATLPFPGLPQEATTAHVFPALAQHSLLSVGNFCDAGCKVTFTNTDVQVQHPDAPLITGTRTPNGLWTVPLQQRAEANAATTVIPQSSNITELLNYLHACCFSPTKRAWLTAIRNGHFTTWPGVTVKNVTKHFHQPIATALGHLDQQRKNIKSTKPKELTPEEKAEQLDANPTSDPDNRQTHHVYAAIETIHSPTGKIASDQTGQFPIPSANGMKYVMVVYDYDSNAIIAAPLPNRTAASILMTYKTIHQQLVKAGLRPKLQRLDNEASNILKQYLDDNDINFQLVPPGMHRRNAAERAIRTWKNHFIAGLCTTDPQFPLYLWDALIDQANITLNLLRTSRINPKLSAYAQMNGNFDFNRTPLAPPGTKIVAHVKPDQRASWDPHGNTGWYTGPAMEHYRCYRCFITKTRSYRTPDTVEFFPHKLPLPKLSAADAATHAAQDLIHALTNPHPHAPSYNFGDGQLTALRELATIFGSALPRVAAKPDKTFSAATIQAPPPELAPPAKLSDMFKKPEHCINPNNLFANAVVDPDTGKAMTYRELLQHPKTKEAWSHSAANEFGRLAQGVGGRIQGTNTIKFIHKHEVPANKNPTYANFVCDVRPQKAEPNRTRLTVGGNLIDYPGDTSAPTAEITTYKCLANSVISTPGARCCLADVKNFYLNTPMKNPEFMRIHISLIPDEIIKEYNLQDKVHNGWIYVRIEKGMYGLPQAGILANKLLEQRLGRHGYYQCRHTPGLWRHATRPITFTLVVDDFAIKYESKDDINHLLNLLRRDYEAVSVDWEASLYCGITCKWDYVARTCEMSMPGYVNATLEKYSHPDPARPQDNPHRNNPIHYGAKVQLTDKYDDSAPLDKDGIKRIQQIIGTLLYYARAVDPTMLVTLSTLASKQSKATELTARDVNQLLDYCATHPESSIRYLASNMILTIHSDAGYLNETKARSRAGGHFFFGTTRNNQSINNGAIYNPTGILRHVASSAAEAEYGALFINCKEGVVLRKTLADMGHPQPQTLVITDNSTADGIANDTIKQQRSRAIDMRYHWVRDRIVQKQFRVEWHAGKDNKADYFTKHHPGSHHRKMRPQYLHCPHEKPTYCQICEGVLNPGATSPGDTQARPKQSNGYSTSTGFEFIKRACQLESTIQNLIDKTMLVNRAISLT